MAFPFFYSEEISPGATKFILNEDASRHIVQVLRMKTGDIINLTNGKGYLFSTEISDNNKKKTEVRITGSVFVPLKENRICIAISPVKNTSRFEWFLEKATEIGVTEIVLLICSRTEKQHYRIDRLKNIMVSAMLQSQQVWLPMLADPIKFYKFVLQQHSETRLIAHCMEDHKERLSASTNDSVILIGPEGDFTEEEISIALKENFKAVSLGSTRLRTETAGMVAAAILASR